MSCRRAFSRAADAGNDSQLMTRNPGVDVLQIVNSSASKNDITAGRVCIFSHNCVKFRPERRKWGGFARESGADLPNLPASSRPASLVFPVAIC